jgi:hypothetical protein
MSEAANPSTAREDDRPEGAAPDKVLPPAALRALAEAAERRALAAQADRAPEHGGAAGPEPTRFGDWERKGVAVDF